MAFWMDLVRTEMENLESEQLIEPDSPVESRDHVVGELDMAMRRLYTLGLLYLKEFATVAGNLVIVRSHERAELEKRACEYGRKADLLKDLFWLSLSDQFGLWTKPSVGIRVGWKVVWSDVEERQTFLLRDLLGQ